MMNIKQTPTLILIALCLFVSVVSIYAQEQTIDARSKQPEPQTSKKVNQRPAASQSPKAAAFEEPFDKASVAMMAAQCVKLETEAGIIELEMLPEVAPETVRNFLNLVAIKAYDTTVFSRVVPGFVVQGGSLATREKITPELAKRAQRTIIDEPNIVRHIRGIVSMARSSAPNSATTSFFILVDEAVHLDGTFAAFGRVTRGMEVVDAINKMPVEGEKPVKPVRLTRAAVATCPVQKEPS